MSPIQRSMTFCLVLTSFSRSPEGNWTQEEDDIIFQKYLECGSSWSRISKQLEGRTENAVKNR